MMIARAFTSSHTTLNTESESCGDGKHFHTRAVWCGVLSVCTMLCLVGKHRTKHAIQTKKSFSNYINCSFRKQNIFSRSCTFDQNSREKLRIRIILFFCVFLPFFLLFVFAYQIEKKKTVQSQKSTKSNKLRKSKNRVERIETSLIDGRHYIVAFSLDSVILSEKNRGEKR